MAAWSGRWRDLKYAATCSSRISQVSVSSLSLPIHRVLHQWSASCLRSGRTIERSLCSVWPLRVSTASREWSTKLSHSVRGIGDNCYINCKYALLYIPTCMCVILHKCSCWNNRDIMFHPWSLVAVCKHFWCYRWPVAVAKLDLYYMFVVYWQVWLLWVGSSPYIVLHVIGKLQ